MKHKPECDCGLCRVKAERQQAFEARQKGLKAPRWETKVGDPKPPTPKPVPRCDCSTCRFSRQQAAGGSVVPDPWQAIRDQMRTLTAQIKISQAQMYTALTGIYAGFTTSSGAGSHLNGLQQSCSGEPFEFAAGALTLWRRFNVGIADDGDACLYGAQQNLWTEAEMTAQCKPRGYLGASGHEAPDESCACGIYAFSTPDIEASGLYRRPATWGWSTGPTYSTRYSTSQERMYASAIVECWGNILIGSKGVRAEKARIVALHIEWPQELVTVPVMTQLQAGELAGWLLGCIPEPAELAISQRQEWREMPPDPAVLQALTARYPNVKIYPTHGDMLAAHPLSDLPGEA